jgi:copper transport protein
MNLRRALVVAVLAAGALVAAASPAAAHADLLETNPSQGEVLTTSPKVITLTFTEPVETTARSVRVYGADEQRVDDGSIDVVGNTVRVPMPELDDGAYVVTWRVTSTDAHPIEGAFTFQVGAAGNASGREVTGLAERLLASEGGDQTVGVLWGIARWAVFASLALLLGVVAFGVLVFPAGRTNRWTRRLAWTGWIGLVVATVVGLLLYGPYVAGLGLDQVLSTSLLSETLDQRLGEVWAFRLVLLGLALPVLLAFLRRVPDSDEPRRLGAWWVPSAILLGIALAATPGLAGHASSGDWQTAAEITDTLHVLSMAIWLGGLVAVAAVLLPGRGAAELRATLPRWSRLALGCVIVIVATGAFQTWRQVGGLDALRSTDYGRILIVKLVLFAAIMVLAAFSREIVFRLYHQRPATSGGGMPVVAGGADDGDAAPDPRVPDPWMPASDVDERTELVRLRRSVWAEVAIAAAVLAATALLVNAAPAKAIADGRTAGLVETSLESDAVTVDITLTPGRAGPNDVHVNTVSPSGAPKQVEDLTITFALPDRKIAPIEVPLRDLGSAHYLSPGFDIPFAGEWKVTAKPRLTEFEQPTLRGTIDVGG